MDLDTNTVGDRRKHQRLPRLIRLRVGVQGEWSDGVTVDVSASGAYVAASVPGTPGPKFSGGPDASRQRGLPSPGAEVVLRPGGHLGIIVTGVVGRVVAPGTGNAVPGYSVIFDKVRSTVGDEALERFLAELGVSADRAQQLTQAEDAALPTPPTRLLAVPPGGFPGRPTVQEILTPDESGGGPFVEASRMLLQELAQAERRLWSGVERRRVERMTTRADVSWQVEAVDVERLSGARLRSISRSGAFLETAAGLPPLRSRVSVVLPIPGAPAGVTVRLVGRVIRHWDPDVDGVPGFAIAITQVDEGQHLGLFRIQLRRYAARRRATHFR